LLPMQATYQLRQPNKGLETEGYRLETILQNDRAGARYVNVLRAGNVPQASGTLQSQSLTATGEWVLTATAGGRTYRLTLPPPSVGAGEIAVATAVGKSLIADRPFPSGVLPHGPEGNRLLDIWDSDYR